MRAITIMAAFAVVLSSVELAQDAAARPASPPATSAQTDKRVWTDCTTGLPAKALPACTQIIDRAQEAPDRLAHAYISRGKAQRMIGAFETAFADFDKACVLKPDLAEAYYQRGLTFYSLNKEQEALADMERAIALDPKHALAYDDRGWMLRDKEPAKAQTDFTKALQILDKDIAAGRNLAENHWARSDAYAGMKQYDRAVAETTLAMRLKPDFVDAIANRAASYYYLSDYDRAIADSTEALRLVPDRYDSLSTRGYAYLSKGKNGEALADFDRSIALNPYGANAFNGRGIVQRRLGNANRALDDFSTAIRLRSDYKYALIGRAQIKSDKEDFAAAHVDFKSALEIDPQFVDTYIARSDTYLAQKDYDRAIADCDHALQIQPKLAVAFHNRARAYVGKSDRTHAIDDLTQAIQIEPKYANAYALRGAQYVAISEFERAIDDVTELLRLSPKYAEAYYWRAAVLMLTLNRPGDRATKIARAIADLKEVLRLQPTHIKAHVELSAAFAAKGDRAEAMAALNDMIRANLGNPEAFLARARVYEALGDWEQAIADLSEAVRLKPGDTDLLKKRAHLRENQSDYPGALADLSEIVAKSSGPAKYAAHIERVQFHKRTNNLPAAVADLTEIAQDKSTAYTVEDKASALVRRGGIHFEMKDVDGALADYSEAIHLAPESVQARGSRAWTLGQTGKYAAALDDLSAILQLRPEDTFALGERGWAYSRLGDYDRAIADLGKAVRLNPKDEDTKAEYARAMAAKQVKFAGLQNGLGTQIVPVIGPAEVITRIAVSPDGSRVAIGGAQRLTLWDAASGRLLHAADAEPSPVKAMAFSPDSRQLYVATARGAITVWDMASMSPSRNFQVGNALADLALSPDGTQLAAGSTDGLELWGMDGQRVPFAGNTRGVNAVAFSPDGALLLAGHEDNKLTLWDKASGQLLRTFEGHTASVTAVAFTPDGKQILSGGGDETLRLWDTATGALVKTMSTASVMPNNFRQPPARITTIAISSDGTRALVQKGATTETWDIATGRKQLSISGQNAAALMPDGRTMLTGGNMRAEFHDIGTGQLIRTIGGRFGSVHSLILLADGTRLFAVSDAVRDWGARTGNLAGELGISLGPVSFTPENNPPLGSLEYLKPKFMVLSKIAEAQSGLVKTVIARDDARMFTYNGSDTLKLRRAPAEDVIKTIEIPGAQITAAEFSFDGDTVIVATLEVSTKAPAAKISLWKTATGEAIRTLTGPASQTTGRITAKITALAVSPDNTQIVSGMLDGTLMLWDVAQGKSTMTLSTLARPYHNHEAAAQSGTAAITSLAFSPDGRWVIVAGGDNGVGLWHARSGELIRTYAGPVGRINKVLFSADGGRVIAGDADGRISIWETESGLLLASFYGAEGGEWLAVTPAGFYAASEKGAQMFGVADGNALRPLDTFRDKLQRPELVTELLKGDPDGKYRDAVKQLNMDAALGAKGGR